LENTSLQAQKKLALGTQKNKSKQKAAAGADTQTVAAAEAAARGAPMIGRSKRQREKKKEVQRREEPPGTVEEAMIKTRAIRVMRSVMFTRLTVHGFIGPAI
jgi:hypothetical protein